MTGARSDRYTDAADDGYEHGDPGQDDQDQAVDQDQAARAARGRRLMNDLDRVQARVDAHVGEHPDWQEVATLLVGLRATASRDLLPPPAASRR